jgi:hypothetical protein
MVMPWPAYELDIDGPLCLRLAAHEILFEFIADLRIGPFLEPVLEILRKESVHGVPQESHQVISLFPQVLHAVVVPEVPRDEPDLLYGCVKDEKRGVSWKHRGKVRHVPPRGMDLIGILVGTGKGPAWKDLIPGRRETYSRDLYIFDMSSVVTSFTPGAPSRVMYFILPPFLARSLK